MKTVRLVPNLSIAALQRKRGKELYLWYCLRAINHWGSGYLNLQLAVSALVAHFSYSKSAAYRILNAGDGIFWSKRPTKAVNRLKIQIYSLKGVARYLDTICGRNFVEIPVSELVKHKGHRVMIYRVLLYATFHKPVGKKATPISRDSIEKATGVSHESQRRYDPMFVTRTATFVVMQDAIGKLIPVMKLVKGKTKEWLVHKHLGNIYHSRLHQGPRGMLKKVNAELAQSLPYNKGMLQYSRGSNRKYRKVYLAINTLYWQMILFKMEVGFHE